MEGEDGEAEGDRCLPDKQKFAIFGQRPALIADDELELKALEDDTSTQGGSRSRKVPKCR